MNGEKTTLALTGAAGGAGTTRCTVEVAATLAREGHDVAILDAAFATQGLSEYVAGPIDTDLTAVVADERDVETALYRLDVDVAGRLVCCPSLAPFERLARAKTAGAARRFEHVVERVGASVEYVLVDTPPIAANQAVAAANVADVVALVAPATPRGADAVARAQGRLTDLDCGADAVVANAFPATGQESPADHPLVDDAVATLPTSAVTRAAEAPVCADASVGAFPAAVGTAVRRTLNVEVPVQTDESGLLERLR